MIDRATKADQGLMPHQQSGTRAAADSCKRHCAAPGFTHSGQRRFSTHFSTQRGNAAESRSSFSWSQQQDGVGDPSLLLASQADSAGSIPVTRSTGKPQVRGLSARPGLTSRGSSDTVRAINGPLASGDQDAGSPVFVVAALGLLGLDVGVDRVRDRRVGALGLV